ncbi:phage tail P2-like protein [Anaerobacterium chartisolvens]|uniref:Phage tail P2-like protein n=1 Tax=Anaerobacterium chartisolvens TaxID=1297424 RepID=A0A369BHI8_9FIRM|nr:phage tail protein I [Anaerobacterium chartisolvens]RCX20871.1 phage tail P2-like protein [Anaerobacterium chartisolvens]
MINLENINLLDLQSSQMKKDPTTIALCAALAPHFRQLAKEVRLCLIYSRIYELDETTLDELAWQMHIDWYDANATLQQKRELVKTAILIHRTRGTPYAVEELIKTYFGDGYIQEWPLYGGEPYMFKVVTSNPSVTDYQAAQFRKVLGYAKNIRSHLEEIIIVLTGEMELYFGSAVHTGDYIQIRQVM